MSSFMAAAFFKAQKFKCLQLFRKPISSTDENLFIFCLDCTKVAFMK